MLDSCFAFCSHVTMLKPRKKNKMYKIWHELIGDKQLNMVIDAASAVKVMPNLATNGCCNHCSILAPCLEFN